MANLTVGVVQLLARGDRVGVADVRVLARLLERFHGVGELLAGNRTEIDGRVIERIQKLDGGGGRHHESERQGKSGEGSRSAHDGGH